MEPIVVAELVQDLRDEHPPGKELSPSRRATDEAAPIGFQVKDAEHLRAVQKMLRLESVAERRSRFPRAVELFRDAAEVGSGKPQDGLLQILERRLLERVAA